MKRKNIDQVRETLRQMTDYENKYPDLRILYDLDYDQVIITPNYKLEDVHKFKPLETEEE